MSKRDLKLSLIREAGYHNDQRQFTRLYVENRISLPVALAEFRNGSAQKASGMKCGCMACKAVTCPA